MTHAGTTIRRARLPAALAVPAGRALLQRWLSDVEPQHHGLPAAALVVVRRVQASSAALAAQGGIRGRDPLAQALRGALRPACEDFVGAGVTAVWFADEAELLACMARDALHDSAHQRWWWPLVLGTSPDRCAMQARWCAGARSVPQALAELAPRGEDAAWLRLLQAPGRAALLMALTQHHPVGPAAVRCVQDSERRALAARQDPPDAAAQPAGLPLGDGSPPRADPVQVLLRLADVLRTEPQRALGEPVVTLLHGGTGVPGGPVLPLQPVARPSRQLPNPLGSADFGLASTSATGPSRPGQADTRAVPEGRAWRRFEAAGAGPAQAPQAARASPGELSDAISPLRRAQAAAPALTQRPGPSPQATPVTSEFGGLCFLLNVALAAGFYGDFTRPRHAGLPVSPWRFLHAAGVAFFGRAFKADPLAGLMARRMTLGAGPQALPPAPASWRLDAACLRPYAADQRPWHVLRSDGPSRIVHPAGFVVAQGAADGELMTVLAQAPGLVWHPVARLSVHGQGLLGLLWPWLAGRLALALGLPATRPALNLAMHLALRQPARVAFSGEQLHLHFSLSALPLAVRLAGLDRDPGWVPAAGCDFRFHFD